MHQACLKARRSKGRHAVPRYCFTEHDGETWMAMRPEDVGWCMDVDVAVDMDVDCRREYASSPFCYSSPSYIVTYIYLYSVVSSYLAYSSGVSSYPIYNNILLKDIVERSRNFSSIRAAFLLSETTGKNLLMHINPVGILYYTIVLTINNSVLYRF